MRSFVFINEGLNWNHSGESLMEGQGMSPSIQLGIQLWLGEPALERKGFGISSDLHPDFGEADPGEIPG